VYSIKAIFSIECEIPSLKLVVEILPNTTAEEECLLYLMQLDETRHDVALVIETQKKRVKARYDKHVKPFTLRALSIKGTKVNLNVGRRTLE
jgi:hypothetical protein